MAKNSGVCKLCSNQRELCYSHIIPEFMYKALYSNNHKFNGIQPDGSVSKLQKGLREYLLCADCEGKLNKYETYSSILFRRLIKENFKGEVLCESIDYKQLKLFLLSILWRAGVTTVPTFAIDLGPHEERIRDMIVNENPGKENEYPCVIYFFKDERIKSRRIYPPRKLRLEGHRCFRFLISRFLFIFFVSSHNKSEKAKLSLRSNGSLNVILLNNYKDMPEHLKANNIFHENWQ